MSSNPYALDFGGVNQGLAALFQGLKEKRMQEDKSSADVELMKIFGPRPDVGYRQGSLQGGEMIPNADSMATGNAITDARMGPDYTNPGTARPFNIPAKTGFQQTTRQPTQQEALMGLLGLIKDNRQAGPGFQQFVAVNQMMQGMADAPKDREQKLEEFKAKMEESRSKVAKDKAYAIYLAQQGGKGNASGYYGEDGDWIPTPRTGIRGSTALKTFKNPDGSTSILHPDGSVEQAPVDTRVEDANALFQQTPKGRELAGLLPLPSPQSRTKPPLIKDGMTATNPKTGEKMVFKDGSWRKM